MKVDSVVIIAILSMSYTTRITTRIVKTQTSVAKIPRVPVENQISTLSVVKIAIKFSPCSQIMFIHTRREFLTDIIYKNIAIIAIQHGKFILLTPQAIFPILLGEIHSSPYGKFPYTYQLKLPIWRVVITIQYGKNRHTVYSFFFRVY